MADKAKKILILPGDGIGPEVTAQAVRVLEAVKEQGAPLEWSEGLIGGCAIDAEGNPLPPATLKSVRAADAVLMGAVGAPQYDGLPSDKKPEKGLLRIRAEMGVFANLRPAFCHPPLAAASPLKPDLVSGLDILIVRELTGGIYFGQPRGAKNNDGGKREAFNTMRYSEDEIARLMRAAFDAAMKRGRRVCSVDKANVLEVGVLWREVANEVARDYPQAELTHLYADNAAMQLMRNPRQFDVIATGNLFGDILSDEAAMLTGSIGMLPSASLNESGRGLYEPVHGSAPDIAGRDIANPLAAILSAAMMLRHSLDMEKEADKIEEAVRRVIEDGGRTADIATPGEKAEGCAAMGDAVLEYLR